HAHLHAARIRSNRLVKIGAYLGKLLDLRQQCAYLGSRKAHQARDVFAVLPAGQIRIEPHAEFQDRRHATTRPYTTLGRTQRPSDDLEQRALACAVLADDAQRLSRVDGKADVPQHPMILDARRAHAEPAAEPAPLTAVFPEGLADIPDLQYDCAHSTSTMSGAALRNNSSEHASRI